jgi:hypothetical protein
MWFAAVGAFLIVAAVLGPRFGFTLYTGGRPGVKGRVDNSLYGRITTWIAGLALIVLGLWGDSLKFLWPGR